MDKKYIYKQLDLIENEMKGAYDTMVEYGFNLTHEGLNSLIKTICIRTDNIKRELNKEYGSISKDINSGGFFFTSVSVFRFWKILGFVLIYKLLISV